jgi:uncharacterized membrane protein
MNEELKQLLGLAIANKGRVIGTFFGFLVGLAALFFGFFKALLFAFFVLAGYYIGQRFDKRLGLIELIERFFPPG